MTKNRCKYYRICKWSCEEEKWFEKCYNFRYLNGNINIEEDNTEIGEEEKNGKIHKRAKKIVQSGILPEEQEKDKERNT